MDNGSTFAMAPFIQDNLTVLIILGACALFALFVIAGMVVGARNKSLRVAAEREEAQRIEELRASGVEVKTVDEGGMPVAEPEARTAPASAPAPVASPVPTPPPVAEPREPEPTSDPAPAPDIAAPASIADEPIPAAAPLDASPATVAADAPTEAAPMVEEAMPVTRLKGLGPRIAARLEELGVTTVDQLAALDDREAADLDARLGPFTGRMMRDRWVEQARLLAAGDRAGYEAQFGKLG